MVWKIFFERYLVIKSENAVTGLLILYINLLHVYFKSERERKNSGLCAIKR